MPACRGHQAGGSVAGTTLGLPRAGRGQDLVGVVHTYLAAAMRAQEDTTGTVGGTTYHHPRDKRAHTHAGTYTWEHTQGHAHTHGQGHGGAHC